MLLKNSNGYDSANQIDDSAPVRRPSSAFLAAGPTTVGSVLPAVVDLPDADDAVSPVRATAPAEDPHSGLTR